MTLRFERGGWIVDNDTLRKLNSLGYTASGLRDDGEDYYVLYRWTTDSTSIVFETQNVDTLNRYVKLIIGGDDEDEN